MNGWKTQDFGGYYPLFGVGGSEWHLPDDCYQTYTSANAWALTTIGVIAVFMKFFLQ